MPYKIHFCYKHAGNQWSTHVTPAEMFIKKSIAGAITEQQNTMIGWRRWMIWDRVRVFEIDQVVAAWLHCSRIVVIDGTRAIATRRRSGNDVRLKSDFRTAENTETCLLTTKRNQAKL